MGSGLGKSVAKFTVGLVLFGSFPLADSAAQSSSKRGGNAMLVDRVGTTPVAQFVPAGEYALTAINGRPVRDTQLSKSRATFSTASSVNVVTACNTISGSVESRRIGNQIIGFGELIATEMGCAPAQQRAQDTTWRLLRDTTNIARAGSVLTFYNSQGDHIAQWTPIYTLVPLLPANKIGQQRTASSIASGDYILSEINGVNLVTATAQLVPDPLQPPRQKRVAIAPNTNRLLVSLPTLFLRENGNISGSTGCNRFNTSILNARGIVAGLAPVVSSKMTCLNPQARILEAELLSAFRQTVRLDARANTLDLYAANDTRLARFTAINARPQSGPRRQIR